MTSTPASYNLPHNFVRQPSPAKMADPKIKYISKNMTLFLLRHD
jgi:hypothetical protein